MPLVSVIVPVHNGGSAFRQCLAALAQACPAPYEIIIVADGETDGSWQDAPAFGARVLVSAQARGPAHARNRGAEVAQGDILFFVDADVVIRPDTIGRMLAVYEQHPDVAAVIGSYDDAPGNKHFLSQYRNLLHHFVHQHAREEATTFWGACGAVRRDIFMQVGGFDESYTQPCIEDIELGYRITQAGYPIQLVKDLQVKHLKRWQAVQMMKVDLFQRAIPWTQLLFRYRRFDKDLNLRSSDRISALLAFIILGFLVAALWHPFLLFYAGMGSILFLVSKVDFFAFLLQKRGILFSLGVLPWLLVHFLICGLGFAIGAASSVHASIMGKHLVMRRSPLCNRSDVLFDRNTNESPRTALVELT